MPKQLPPRLGLSKTNLWTAGGLLLVMAIGTAVWLTQAWSQRPAAVKNKLEEIPFDGKRAFQHLEAICEIGPRVTGTAGMQQQQAYLQKHFESLGGKVELQKFEARHPETGDPVGLANMLVQWHPDKKERILLCCHYDTRPFPDADPDITKRRDTFIGANDGASGAALLCELAQQMPTLKSKYGVDFVLFDGEELIYNPFRDKYFLGSEYFSQQHVAHPPTTHRYRWGVLVDMIGDADLQIFREINSSRWPQTRPLVDEIWGTARAVGVREFYGQMGHEVRDDHLALTNTAKIPTIDIIDFDYPRSNQQSYWHTTQDLPQHCSALSLAKVGYVLIEWLKRAK